MNGKSHELLMAIIGILKEWENDYRTTPENFDYIINRFNSFLLHNTNVKPVKHMRNLLSCLQNETVKKLGFNVSDELDSVNIINEDGQLNKRLKLWYDTISKLDDVDQDLVKEFLFDCRREYKETEDVRIFDMYADVRSFINPSNHIITADKIMSLISKHSNVSESIFKIKDWYESIPLESTSVIVCPVCGNILQSDIFNEGKCTEMCMYYRDKLSLKPKEVYFEDKRKYRKLKHGIYTYTLIPGIAELRMYDQLSSNYESLEIDLYPQIDKFDIGVRYFGGQILLDVKDFASPYNLVDTLVSNKSFIKMHGVKEGDIVFLVIPEHRKYLYRAGDYKNIVRRHIRKASSQVKVIYENELNSKVGEIVNELQ